MTRKDALTALADTLRPDLHRYAARLMGSVIDGEDVVQDTFLRAFAAIQTLPEETPLRPWLFRIAHNRALDLLRRAGRLPPDPEEATAPDGLDLTLRREAVGLAISRFAGLNIPQRATVILKDVLDEPLAEIAALLDLSLDAVKAHLARGRARLSAPQAEPRHPASPEAQRFAALFNAQDWDACRALLAEDVRLNQARRPLRRGRAEVGRFFSFYADYPPVRLTPAWIDGREVLLVLEEGVPRYFMWLTWEAGRIAAIHDHRYADYILDGVILP